VQNSCGERACVPSILIIVDSCSHIKGENRNDYARMRVAMKGIGCHREWKVFLAQRGCKRQEKLGEGFSLTGNEQKR
jgi:hypothetical protein